MALFNRKRTFLLTPIDQCWGSGKVSDNVTRIDMGVGEELLSLLNQSTSMLTFFPHDYRVYNRHVLISQDCLEVR